MLTGIKQAGLKLPDTYPTKWVVDCQAVGGGRQALIYLGRYLYRGVIQEKDILSCDKGNVTLRYQNSQTRQTETRPAIRCKCCGGEMKIIRTRIKPFTHRSRRLASNRERAM
ncbi:hypothetical protein NTGBS_240012 [Candidatus Nitrotoga sp. BS]|nr:hypothetical protein NTGBS_240012 [Candidatus Nitrotoga sp. BS]